MSWNADEHERELASGLWPRVHARLRPLHDWERPVDALPADARMVEFFRYRAGKLELADIEWYDPLRERDMLGEFMHLFGGEAEPSDAGVLDFYARWGPLRERVLREGSHLPAWALRLEPQAQEHLGVEARALMCEPLWWLRERARELRLTYDLYRALRENRLSFVRALIGGIPQGKRLIGLAFTGGRVIRDVTDEDGRRVGSFSIEALPADDPAAAGHEAEPLRWLTDDECAAWGELLLAGQLNLGEERSRRRWSPVLLTPDPAGPTGPHGEPPPGALRLVRCRSVRDLLAALHLHLGDLVAEHALMWECEGCRRLFFPRRSDQRFCDSHCGDAARQRAYYAQAKKQAAAAKTGPKAKTAKKTGRKRSR